MFCGSLTIELVDVSPPTKSIITTFRPLKPLIATNLIGTVKNPPRTNFDISFTITPFSTNTRYTNILRFTNRKNHNNSDGYGDRVPALFIRPNNLNIHVTQGSTKNPNHSFNTNVSLTMNIANKLKLSYSGDEVSLYMNGALAGSMTIPLSDRPQMDQWLIYGSDKNYVPANANVVDLTIELTTCYVKDIYSNDLPFQTFNGDISKWNVSRATNMEVSILEEFSLNLSIFLLFL